MNLPCRVGPAYLNGSNIPGQIFSRVEQTFQIKQTTQSREILLSVSYNEVWRKTSYFFILQVVNQLKRGIQAPN